MKNILLEQKKIKLRNKWHFVENKTDYAACLRNEINFSFAEINKAICTGVSLLHSYLARQVFKRLNTKVISSQPEFFMLCMVILSFQNVIQEINCVNYTFNVIMSK
jgi:hypothetical protein